jgi:FO synthase
MARILLHGAVDNIQCSWVKLGVDGCRQVLGGGVNDLGGTLMEETISRMAGSRHGSRRSVAELEGVAAGVGRPSRQRTTTYGRVPAERHAAARRAPPASSAGSGEQSPAGRPVESPGGVLPPVIPVGPRD